MRVAVTGAAGQIGYALLFRIAAGGLFGPDQRVRLQLLEVPQAENALQGVVMELRDGACPLLEDIVATSDPNVPLRVPIGRFAWEASQENPEWSVLTYWV